MTTKAKPPRITEADILRQVVEAAALFGVELKRRNVGMALNPKGQPVRFGESGESDLYGALGSRTLFVEVKRPGKRPTAKQLAFLHRENARGNVALWVNDAAQITETLPKLLEGWRVEIDEDGQPWRTDEPMESAP